MKTTSCSPGLILVFAIAPLALATAAQRGPAMGGAAGAANMACNGICDGTGKGGGTGAGRGACGGDSTCAALANDTTPLALGTAAQAALLFQIDEERMAGELYTAFGAKWGLPPFAHIPLAETRHEAVLRQLATRAGLTVPTAVAGRFDSAEVQQRHDALLALGHESADSALRVGAYVEEVDIADLNTLLATTDNVALKDAATALKSASGHHLNAFVGLLAARGITYVPQVLKADEYQAMLAGDGRGMGRGRGRGGQGQGWGHGPGRG